MRKQKKAILWPAYFDQSKSRNEGRRVLKSSAVPSPKIDEVTEAVCRLGLEHEVRPEVGYPKTPWLKTGMVMVEKKEPKEQIIKKIAQQLLKIRSSQQQKQKQR